jgi:hypothetical protein
MNNLFLYVEKLASGLDSKYSGIRYDKARLVEFMEANEWFEITPTIRDKAPHITTEECETIGGRLRLWLSAFKQPDNVKLEVLLNHFEPEYPNTCALYREFAESNNIGNSPGAWKLLDCVFFNFAAEITECDEYEIEEFVRHLDSDATLDVARLFAKFMRFAGLSKWSYEFYSRGRPEVSNDAYPLSDYAVMAYCAFNDEMWIRQHLIAKAVGSAQFADLWLFTALCFVCALRGTDLTRLPAPKLPYAPEKVLSDISDGTFPDNLAVALTDELAFRLSMKGLKPLKTSKHSNVSEIKLSVSESLRKPLGTIIAIVLAHHHDIKPGNPFVSGADHRNQYGRFFGTDFVKAMGKRHLSLRRCNKSYLQGIEMATGNDARGRPKGYMLAALARSHKGGIGALPEITDIYLKDANFTGYKPEFIAAQMFERGIFSFIASALLEIYSGKDFTLLPVASQTALIATTGLVPAQIENVMATLEIALLRAHKTVSELICRREPNRQQIGNILQNIASGGAPSRMRECLCLMSAAGEHCPHPDRAGCIGCGYEIYTKSAMQLLMREYGRLRSERGAVAKSERWRHTAILNNAVLPAIEEIVSCAKSLAPGSDISSLLDIAKRGFEPSEPRI